MEVYLEIGQKRTFASALDWPGWCRAGRDEETALQALIDYAPRYSAVVGAVAPDFEPPAVVDGLMVTARLNGDATTDFGAPGAIPAADGEPVGPAEFERLVALLDACWSAFEEAARSATGKRLATGPRGGGRDLENIRQHVVQAEESYARTVGGGTNFGEALRARWRGEVPDTGPRGGLRWPVRYAVRRSAWHLLDHAWEIEDRASP